MKKKKRKIIESLEPVSSSRRKIHRSLLWLFHVLNYWKNKKGEESTIERLILLLSSSSFHRSIQFYQKKGIIDKPIKIWYRPTITRFRIFFIQRSIQQGITYFLRDAPFVSTCLPCAIGNQRLLNVPRFNVFNRIASRCAEARRVLRVSHLHAEFIIQFQVQSPSAPTLTWNSVDNRPWTRFEIFQLCPYVCVCISNFLISSLKWIIYNFE